MQVDAEEKASGGWRDGVLIVVALGSLPFLLLELVREDLPTRDRLLVDIVNVLVLVLFSLDYISGLFRASDKGRYLRAEWLMLGLVMTQAIALVPALSGVGVLRVLRASRAIRPIAGIFRVIALGKVAASRERQWLRENALRATALVSLLTWLTSAAAFTVVEDVGAGGRIESFQDSLWWALVTMATVGYGDVYPITMAGRVIAGFTMVVGISAFGVVTASVARFLLKDS